MEKFEEVEVVEGGGKEYRREQEYTRFLDSGFRMRFTFSFTVLMYCCLPGGVSSVSSYLVQAMSEVEEEMPQPVW